MAEEGQWEPQELPDEIGLAVTHHYLIDMLSGFPLAQPTRNTDVLTVSYTVMNHTEMTPQEVADYIPLIRGLMAALYESWSPIQAKIGLNSDITDN